MHRRLKYMCLSRLCEREERKISQRTQVGWERLIHSQYSPDVAPSDCHLFGSLERFLSGKRFTEIKEVKNHPIQFSASQSSDFYRQEIKLLPESIYDSTRILKTKYDP
jgi:hypothetical protein